MPDSNIKTDEKWLMSSFVFGQKPEKIDKEAGVLSGVYIVTEGEAKGHGVSLDADFIADTIKNGNEKKQGLKVRFGHPNMSSTALGTFLGRAKNFTAGTTPDGKCVAIADVFLSNSAKDAPQGDLYNYVLSLASEDSKAFGMSIVFERFGVYRKDSDGKKYYEHWRETRRSFEVYYTDKDGNELDVDREKLTEQLFVEQKSLLASDLVDDPAANPNGIFSAFNDSTIAGQVSEFLDLHPQVFGLAQKRPELINTFFDRYEIYKKSNKENKQMADAVTPVSPESTTKVQAESTPEPVKTALSAQPPPAVAPIVVKPVEPVKAEPVAVPELAKKDDDSKTMFKQMLDVFGAEIASEVFAAGGNFADAQKKHTAKLEAENKELKDRVQSLEKLSGTEPVKVPREESKPFQKMFKTV